MKTLSNELSIALLESQKRLPGANTDEIDKQIEAIKLDTAKQYGLEGKKAGELFIQKFQQVTGSKENNMDKIMRIFDPQDELYIDKLKQIVEDSQYSGGIFSTMFDSESNVKGIRRGNAQRKIKEGDKTFGEGTVFQIANVDEETKKTWKDLYSTYVSDLKKKAEIENGIIDDTVKKNEDAAQKIADARKKGVDEFDKYIRDEIEKPLDLQLNLDQKEIDRTFNIIQKEFKEKLKPVEFKIEFPKNPLISLGMEKEYDSLHKQMEIINEAIKIQTEFYGKESEQVKKLIEQLKNLKKVYPNANIEVPKTFTAPSEVADKDWFKALSEEDQEKLSKQIHELNEMNNVTQKLAGSLDNLANSFAQISDNPAIKTLAFSLTLLAGAQAMVLAAKSKSWIEFVVAVAATLASTIKYISTLRSQQSFATGGIVSPANSGDQVNVRLNPGEMVLNGNQQRRLFNTINSGRPDNTNNNQVEFRLQGQQLVGLINNYTRKHS